MMHKKGANAPEAAFELQHMDQLLTDTMVTLDEHTGLLIIADHGHIDVETSYMCDYPDLIECFRYLPSLESRTVNFFIKDGYHSMFKKRFNEYFSTEFILLEKTEVMQSHVFGIGFQHPRFQDFLGDYLAIAIKNRQLVYDRSFQCKGNHAGMTKEELLVPLILYSNTR